jgi:hypothetical protein
MEQAMNNLMHYIHNESKTSIELNEYVILILRFPCFSLLIEGEREENEDKWCELKKEESRKQI